MSLHLHPAGRNAEEERRMDAALAGVDALALRSLREQQARRRRLIAAAASVVAIAGAGAASWYATRASRAAEPRTMVAEGWRLWRERRHHEAEARFVQATAAAPSLVEGWNGLGWARLHQGNASGAREAFDRCLALDDRHGACHNGLGNLSFGRCDDARAEAHWTAAADRAPAARYGLTRLLLLQGRFAEARRWTARLAADPAGGEQASAMAAAAERGQLDEPLRRKLQRSCRPAEGGTP